MADDNPRQSTLIMVAGSFGGFRKGNAVLLDMYQPRMLLPDFRLYT